MSSLLRDSHPEVFKLAKTRSMVKEILGKVSELRRKMRHYRRILSEVF